MNERQISRRSLLKGGAVTAAVAGSSLLASSVDAAAAPTPDNPLAGLSRGVAAGIKQGQRFRIRELGVIVGRMTPGPFNAITDVPGVTVGYKTLNFDTPGIARTGVTIIQPRKEPIWTNYTYGAYFSFNGNGEMTGSHWLDEVGWLTSAIGITNTHQVGIVRDTLIKIESEQNSSLSWRLPVVAETYDGSLNDINKFWITEQDVRDAVADAKSGVIDEGNVGGGTGMACYGFKGGSGTASRVVPYNGTTYTVGVFVQTNFGSRVDLKINGAPVGAELLNYPPPTAAAAESRGSCIIIVGTDAPLDGEQCRRLALRAAIGQGRTGAQGSNGDGDISFAFATGNNLPSNGGQGTTGSPLVFDGKVINNNGIGPFFEATIEATMEAIYNSMTKANTLVGLKRTLYAIPLDQMLKVIKKHKDYPLEYPPPID